MLSCSLLFSVYLTVSCFAIERPIYRIEPLVSIGGKNIAPEIVQGLKGFQKSRGKKPQYVEISGIGFIKLWPKSEIKFCSSISPKMLYKVSFYFSFSAGAGFDYNTSYPGLHGWISLRDANGMTVNSWRIREQRNSTYSMQYEASVYSTNVGKAIWFTLRFNGIKGYALISDIQVREEQILAENNRHVIKPPSGIGGRSYGEVRAEHVGATKLAAPRSLKAETRPGMGKDGLKKGTELFYRTDPDRVFFYSLPEGEESGKSVRVALTPGEVTIFTIAVRPVQCLSALRLDSSILKDHTGKPFLGTIDWKVIRYHPRRIDYYGRGKTWHWVADHFFNAKEGIDAEADRTQVFWIKVMAGPGSTAGSYTGKIYVRTADGPLGEMPIEVVVRPFALVEIIDRARGIYPDSRRWVSHTDKQVLDELDDFKSHGINTLLVPAGRPVVRNGEITGWWLDERSERKLALISRAKMDGPFVVWFGWLDAWLAKHFNLSVSEMEKDPALWPETVKSAYRKCLILFKDEFEQRGLGNVLFHAVDEPRYSKKGSPEQFSWKYKTSRDVGLETYCTSSYLPSDPLGVNLTYHCYGKSILISPKRTSFIKKKTHEADQKFWYYATGCYSGQIGNIVRNRYLSGFIFFRSGADGLMSWTFQRPHGDPFDDFYAGKTGQPCITYPDPKHAGENLDTPQWEGLRQGWYDYRYAATLAKIAENSTDAKKELDKVLDSMPWNGDIFRDGAVTNEKCDKWREEIAKAIERFSN